MKDTKFVGILNLTPDSFSDGGRFADFGGGDDVLAVAGEMLADGASILDIGGESTGPGSKDVSLDEELRRVIPVIEKIKKNFPDAALSIDTWKSEVAEAALAAGASIVNDVTAGRGDEKMFEIVAKHNVPIVLMYSKQNSPRTDRDVVHYDDVMKTIKVFLMERLRIARDAGVKEIIIDPGMGAFVSGDPTYSYEIIDRASELEELGLPIWIGASRKGFLGEDRFGMTLWTTTQLVGKADYLRVHDVCENASCS